MTGGKLLTRQVVDSQSTQTCASVEGVEVQVQTPVRTDV